MLKHSVYLAQDVLLRLIKVGNRSRYYLRLRGLAPRDDGIIPCLFLGIACAFPLVLLYRREVKLHRTAQRFTEGISHAVLHRLKLIDAAFDRLLHLIGGSEPFLLIRIAVENALFRFKKSDRLALLFVRPVCRIHESLFRIGDKIEHEVIVKVLSHKPVELVDRHFGKRILAEGKIITHRKEVRHRFRKRVAKDVSDARKHRRGILI